MRLLLDTNALIWFFERNPRLSSRARREIEVEDPAVHVSAVSAFEIAIKYRSGKLPHVAELAENFEPLMGQYGFEAVPITLRHAQTAGPYRSPTRPSSTACSSPRPRSRP
ncbi:MAG: type II toxin-antitoxin system VapC family toxin [Caulobacteraceae bacterium]